MAPSATVATVSVEEYVGRAKARRTWLLSVEMMMVTAQRAQADRLVRENRAGRLPRKKEVQGESGTR